jgi:hypothetical protein
LACVVGASYARLSNAWDLIEMTGPQLTALEADVIDKLLAGDSRVLECLRHQRSNANVSRRELSGGGFYVHFALKSSMPKATKEASLRLGDVVATIEGLQHDAGFVLIVTDGYLDFLEGYSFDEPWPEQVQNFSVRYVTAGERDLRALNLE